jgi:hypothetical protein
MRLFQVTLVIVVLLALDRAFTGGQITSDVLLVIERAFGAVAYWLAWVAR